MFVGLVGIGGVLWWLGPYEPVDLSAAFEPRKFGEGVQVYFESIESLYPDITPGTEKRVVWAGQRETRTPISVLYVHGFSATSEEIRPVPDRVAHALGANLVFTRLRGHGRGGDAMGKATVADWMHDLAEGVAAARAVGERVVIMATSTGATLAAAAAVDHALALDVAAMVFVSPNFGLHDPASVLLTLPAVRWWGPLVAGDTQSFQPQNDKHALYWTNSYPTVALLPMAALVKAVTALDFSHVQVPALFYLSDDDSVVRPDISRSIAADWGGPATILAVTMGTGDDPSSHVIAGDILSPGQTGAAVTAILDWLTGQGI
ncbi:alpha/beta hydrolase [Sedimentitalea todarodis]|uniref:Alpha/beta fold hydrolase n=1 Tax=Sedimentitalea todarodis TaxID=1631240 RepID=A0ABU3VF65_9RHOB|nr:alpha/beta fold hydrolase [Sedimentitalea todarodis]MDU9004811.1 alpha/beta fold hydrolase [Sedimentitalea todarodis]